MRIRGLVAATGLTAMLVGCAGVAGDPKDPKDVWAEQQAEFLAEHGGFPEGDPPYTEEEAHVALVAQADAWWANTVLNTYPDAVRPTEDFVRWQVAEDQTSLDSDLAKCITSRGLVLDHGTDADGNIVGLGSSGPNSVDTVVSQYFCGYVAYPQRPTPPPNAARLGYIWDYYAEFLVPCFEDNDVPQTPMVSREEWIASYPRFDWNLEYPLAEADLARVIEICPSGPIA